MEEILSFEILGYLLPDMEHEKEMYKTIETIEILVEVFLFPSFCNKKKFQDACIRVSMKFLSFFMKQHILNDLIWTEEEKKRSIRFI